MQVADWRPAPGQVVLIEPDDDDRCLTGVVMPEANGRVTVDLGASPRLVGDGGSVLASIFASDALYRLRATARAATSGSTILDLEIHDVERVQRRSSPRARIALPVALSAFDDDGAGHFCSVRGETVDVGPGGCRVRTRDPFPTGLTPTVSIDLADGAAVLRGELLQAERIDDGWEYRVAFLDVDDGDRERLAALAA